MNKIPKRRKFKDNPYSLSYCEELNTYIVKFKDVTGKINEVEIQEKIYNALNRFELEDISQIHKFRKHIEHNEIFDNKLEERMLEKPISIEEEIENKLLLEDLKIAMKQLSDTQKKRLYLYYFEDKTLREIATMEGCSIKNIHKSIGQAIQKLKKILKI